jgi:3(or 17)beta-hydroxysteroid dehydrogenase
MREHAKQGRVDGKVALITGGASGIGAASAQILSREGASVIITDLQDEAGEALATAINAGGGTALFIRHDVTSEAEWMAVCDQVMSRFGRLDILVNCAGTTVRRPSFPTEATFEEWRRVTSVNLDGVFLGTKHALIAMRASNPVNGSIINISSILGIVGAAGVGAYNASKGGVRAYTKSVALSCAEDGLKVRVNSLHPGFIDTPLLQKALERSKDIEAARKRYDALQPVGHMGEPHDIAYGVLYLASDESRFMTGAELVIDGGYTAR